MKPLEVACFVTFCCFAASESVPDPPFNVSCQKKGSLGIASNSAVGATIRGMYGHCSFPLFRLDKTYHMLKVCGGTGKPFRIQVQYYNRGSATRGRHSAIYMTTALYNITCNGIKSNILPINTSSVYIHTETILPELKMVVLQKDKFISNNTILVHDGVSGAYLGEELRLAIYVDKSHGGKSYSLIPTSCVTYPAGYPDVTMTMLNDTGSGCKKEDTVIGNFTLQKTKSADVVWAPLYVYLFEGYTTSGIMIECAVLVCPGSGGRGKCTSPTCTLIHKSSALFRSQSKRDTRIYSRDASSSHTSTVRAVLNIRYSQNTADSVSFATTTGITLATIVSCMHRGL